MNGQPSPKLRVEGLTELWFRYGGAESFAQTLYRPAALIDCSINFRSLRAGLNHSEERTYTAWLPEGELPIDWDAPAVAFDEGAVSSAPPSDAFYKPGNYLTTREHISQFEAELIDKLVRVERLRVFFNPVFGLFAAPDEKLEDFLARVAEAALGRVGPELRNLRNKFELQLEQIREAHSSEGERAERLSFESFISQKLQLFESENRLAKMFSTLAGSLIGAKEDQADADSPWDEAELHEDLRRLEQEASHALHNLYEEYTALASEYDLFEIGLQPANIQVTRRAVLWVPVE
ncbi:MAG: hypothetical protein AB1631_09900 [Acidobacteriota bacterium]